MNDIKQQPPIAEIIIGLMVAWILWSICTSCKTKRNCVEDRIFNHVTEKTESSSTKAASVDSLFAAFAFGCDSVVIEWQPQVQMEGDTAEVEASGAEAVTFISPLMPATTTTAKVKATIYRPTISGQKTETHREGTDSTAWIELRDSTRSSSHKETQRQQTAVADPFQWWHGALLILFVGIVYWIYRKITDNGN